jgi:threonine 3-dehydrogenase
VSGFESFLRKLSMSVGRFMRALVKSAPKAGLEWVERHPVPSIGPNDILIRVTHASICGTDLHIYKYDSWAQRTIPIPLVVGHEYVGRVAALGEQVAQRAPLRVGDRVTGEGHVTCGFCRNCRAGRQHLCRNTLGVGVNRDGAFADYVAVPARNVVRLPDRIPDIWGAVMDPLGNAVHTALANDLVGEDVLITGAGPIGIMAAGICRHVGARHVVVTDVREERLALARQCGATMAINTRQGQTASSSPDASSGPEHEEKTSEHLLREAMKQLGMTEGFDVGLEMSGVPSAFRSMLATMNHGGRIALLGIPSESFPINWDEVVFKGLTIQGIYGREMFETWYRMINMLVGGLMERIQPVLTHRFPAHEFEKAFKVAGSGTAGKVVLEWDT